MIDSLDLKSLKKITLLIPCFNEEESLPIIYYKISEIADKLLNYEWQFLFINDGSTDNTLSIIKKLRNSDKRVSFIDLSRNFGKEAAMLAGFDYASGDAVIILDADLQHPPSLIPEMIEAWEDGFDDVYAKRRVRGEESWLRKNFSLLFYKVLQGSTKIDVLPNVGDFRLLDSKCINTLCQLRENNRYTKGMFSWIGFKKKEVLFDQGDRAAGKSSWKFSNLFNLAIDGITSFTTSPLRLSAYFGFIISFLAFAYMIFVLIKTIVYGEEVKGFPTLIIIILFLGGIQLISLGIIGEYIGRIFNETKNRPIYVIRESAI